MKPVLLCGIALSLVGLMACSDDAAPSQDAGAEPADSGEHSETDAGPEPMRDSSTPDPDASADAGPDGSLDGSLDGSPDGNVADDSGVLPDAEVDAGDCPVATPADCLGVCGGTAAEDCAGVCNGAATQDCLGACNGSAVVDSCGVCNGNDASKDCAGVCSGTAIQDCLGVCNGAATQDCLGACNGSAIVDSCGVCNGNDASKDCAGVCSGTATQDCLGVCDGSAVCAVPVAGDLVVSEVMFNPAIVDDTLGEWFELYNTTDTYLELEGCTVQDNASGALSITSPVLVAPGGYVTFARSANAGFTPGFVYGSQIQLSNSADEIVLTCSSVEIERFAYAATSYTAAPGASLSVHPPALSSAHNEVTSNWCSGVASYNGDLGTPGTGNVSCAGAPAVGEVIFNEIMINPNTLLDAMGEWFELRNTSSSAVDIGGCVIKDDDTNSLPVASPMVLRPGALVTFASSANPGFTPNVVFSNTVLQIANTADELELVCNLASIDRVAYEQATWTVPVGSSLELDLAMADSVSNDSFGNWCAATVSYNGDNGSPGAPNSTCP